MASKQTKRMLRKKTRQSRLGFFGRAFVTSKLAIIGVLVMMVFSVSAFEAHFMNITAAIFMIEPPVLTAPGDIGWNNPNGGIGLTGVVEVVMTDADVDATHIFYTYGSGLDPLSIPVPVCGQTGPNGGGDVKTNTAGLTLNLTADTVVKAIACDGNTLSAHYSLINTKVYDFTDYACTPQEVDFPADLVVLAAGPVESSTGDIFMSANTTINGDARSNNDINANGGGANRFINGNATAGSTVEVANFTISGTTTQGAPLTTLPNINIPFWNDQADNGGTVMGSLIFPNSVSGIELGPSEIMGNVIFEGSNTALIKGPLHIHGNLIIEQNTTITQDTGFGNQFAAIIVDGTIDIDNNVEFVGNGSGDGSGAFLLVSNAAAQAGDDAAIEVSNDASTLGDVVLYATNGDVHINSNRIVLAIFAKEGTSNVFPAIDLDSNVTVDYRGLPSTISCGEPYTPIEQLLINEFLPNPSDTQAVTSLLSPGAAHLPNDWDTITVLNVQTSNDAYVSDDDGQQQGYSSFGFGIPAVATINGIETQIEVKSSDSAGCQVGVNLSWNNGTSYATQKTQSLTGTDTLYTLGTPSDLWGRVWTATELSDANFVARVQDIDPGGSCIDTALTSVDVLQVRVYYTIPGDLGAVGGALDGEFVEIFNGSAFPVDVNGYVLYDDFVPAGVAASKTWTTDTDFNPGIFSNTFVEISGDDRIRVTTGQTSGTYETVLDAGEGNRGDWQNLTWTETLTAGADVCVDVATSNDGIGYTAFSAPDCASTFSLTGITDSRFIKWRSTHTRTSGLVTNNADLLELTISYTLFNYNELVITPTRTNTGLTTIPSGGMLVVYRDGDTDFELDNDGIDTVKLYTNHVWLGGVLIDSRAYNYGGAVPDNKSFTRMPDGTANWIDPDPTPGEPNEEFIDPDTSPAETIVFESEPLAEGEEEEIPVVAGYEAPIAETQAETPAESGATSDTPSETATSTDPLADTTPPTDEQQTDQPTTDAPADQTPPVDNATDPATEPNPVITDPAPTPEPEPTPPPAPDPTPVEQPETPAQ